MKKSLVFLLALGGCAGAQLERQKNEIEELRVRAGTLSETLKAKIDEAEAAKARAAELDARNAELEGRAAAAESRAESLTRSNASLSQAVGASRDELGAKLQEAFRGSDELARALKEARDEAAAAKREKAVFRSARDKTSRDLAGLRAEHAKLQAERDRLAADAAAAFAAAADAKAKRDAAALETRERLGDAADVLLADLQAGRAKLEQDGERVTLVLEDGAVFEEGSAKLKAGGADLLTRAGAALKALPGRRLRVEAHSDGLPVKKGLLGGYDGPWELAAARAAAAAKALKERGLVPETLGAAGPPSRNVLVFLSEPAS